MEDTEGEPSEIPKDKHFQKNMMINIEDDEDED
jgi:hypothetical protein